MRSTSHPTSATNAIEPVPVRRLHVNLTILLTGAVLFWIAGVIAGFPLIPGANGIPRFDWMADVGMRLGSYGQDAMLQFPGWAFALFGITAGGQAVLRETTARTSLRRLIGALGMLLALATLAVAVFAIAATFAAPARGAALLVVLPAGGLAWGIAVECGRFIVPDFTTQQQGAQTQLTNVIKRRSRVPHAVGTSARAYLVLGGWGAAIGIISAAFVGPVSLPAAAFTFAAVTGATTISLYMYAQLTSAVLISASRTHRILVCVGTWTIHAGLMFLTFANLTTVHPAATLNFAVGLVIALLLPVGFARLPQRVPQTLRSMSLNAVTARFLLQDLDRSEQASRARIAELERHAQTGASTSLLERLVRAVTARRS